MLKKYAWVALICLLLLLPACTTDGSLNHANAGAVPSTPGDARSQETLFPAETSPKLVVPTIDAPFLKSNRPAGGPIQTATPDAPRVLPTMRLESKEYTVQAGDTLAEIAQSEGSAVQDIIHENNLDNPDLLSVGQQLTIPPPTPKPTGPSFKILPDSELVYGPVNGYFDIAAYIEGVPGYLRTYHEEVDGVDTPAAAIVQRISQEYSVNPRLLLAFVEYQSGWLSKANPPKEYLKYPAGWVAANRTGLYHQVAFVANSLNRGFYVWRVNGISHWVLADGSYVPVDPTINAGTAGVQYLLGLYDGYADWLKAVSADGFISTYTRLFGYPFDYAVEPLLPDHLKQPALQLPFEKGTTWSFTGGPHGGWDSGSAWAAIDFAPPGDQVGCVESDDWVVAMADGKILRASNGEVIEDLDGDGLEQTGWTILYMHIETRDRVQPGTIVKAGDRIGHPSCEGGVSSGTHTHIARRYNGEWIPADGNIPFDLDGWISAGYGSEYDGELRRNGQKVVAFAGRDETNQISR